MCYSKSDTKSDIKFTQNESLSAYLLSSTSFNIILLNLRKLWHEDSCTKVESYLSGGPPGPCGCGLGDGFLECLEWGKVKLDLAPVRMSRKECVLECRINKLYIQYFNQRESLCLKHCNEEIWKKHLLSSKNCLQETKTTKKSLQKMDIHSARCHKNKT